MMAPGQPADTIYAVSSGGLPSGVAIIRLSGPMAPDVVRMLVGRLPAPRRATMARICDSAGELLDNGLVLYFAAPASFTGEHCAEFHVHGGRAVVAAILAELSRFDGLRHAEAGEFTKRAFLKGKVDLTTVEALSDLIGAETEIQRRLAVANADGGQSALYRGWRQRLLAIRVLVEADLDFSDEADVSGDVAVSVQEQIAALACKMREHRSGYASAEIIRDGLRVVLVGEPNVGKSSLLNALARRDAALVTDVPGTTRDLIEVALDLSGVKVVVTDTAGLRDSEDLVERLGMDRTRSAARNADIIVSLVDQMSAHADAGAGDAVVLRVGSKADVGGHAAPVDYRISSRTGAGIDSLIGAIGAIAREKATWTDTIPSRARQVAFVDQSLSHLDAAVRLGAPELIAEELRLASERIGRITGEIGTEELLGAIFSEFCIGK